MEKELNELLKHALTPTDEPDFWLNQKILNQVKEQKAMEGRKKIRYWAAILAAVMVLCLSSVTVYAAWRYLSPADVAEKMSDFRLAEAFLGENALLIDETQSYGGRDVTLLGIASGEMLSEYAHYSEGGVLEADRTYAVVAIKNSDGTPLPDTSEEAYGALEFFVSPLIQGYNPAFYNILSMNGDYTEMNEDGILYRLVRCDNIEVFADRDLYLCVCDGTFFDKELYRYDETTGMISRNESYEGLNALFRLPIAAANADPEKAKEYVRSLGITDMKADFGNIAMEIKDPLEMEIAGNSKEGIEVAEYAVQFLGNSYKWGESSLTEGTDSSGFVKSVYEHFDVSLPHSASEDKKQGRKVENLESAEPGDLICYDNPSHVAIYIGDGKIVHAYPEIGVCISEAEYDEIVAIRRVLEEE